LIVRGDPSFTPTMPKPGETGKGLAHWGKLTSKPVALGARDVAAVATPTFAASATTARARAAKHFVRGTTRTQGQCYERPDGPVPATDLQSSERDDLSTNHRDHTRPDQGPSRQ
jgi:hypothetical protein